MLTTQIAATILALASTAFAQQGPWQQCGGIGWEGSTTCVAGWTCVPQNDWYYQCVEGSGPPGSTTTTTSTRTTTTSRTSTATGTTTTTTTTTRTTTAAPTTTSGGGGGGSCTNAPVNQLVGYGAGTTGGGSGSGVTVSSCSALSSAIGSGGVIRVSGTLSGCGIIDVEGSTTIVGVGANAGFVGGGLRIRRVSNVIIRNLSFRNPGEGRDSLALDEAVNVWVDHNEFSNDGIVGDKDYYDGQLDITHASDLVTVSWNTFADHWKGSLVGHSASNGAEDRGHLRVTYHHNWWNNVNSRTPSIRFGTGHIYSSCYENIPTSGLNIRETARALVENNYFRNVNAAIVTNVDADLQGFVTERNNVFVSSPIAITQTGHTAPSYSYTLDPASCICDRVKSQAGTGIIS